MDKQNPSFLSPREEFKNTWLCEMPLRLLPIRDMYRLLTSEMNEWVDAGYTAKEIGPGLHMVGGNEVQFFYILDHGQIAVIAELHRKPNAYAVAAIGKSPTARGKPPYAVDLYKKIVDSMEYPMLLSDKMLTDSSISLWKKLVNDPNYRVSVFDDTHPTTTFTDIDDPAALDDYLNQAHPRFVLSKSGTQYMECKHRFSLQRLYEVAGYEL